MSGTLRSRLRRGALIAATAASWVVIGACSPEQGIEPEVQEQDTLPPAGLVLPVRPDDLPLGSMVNPFGVVRSSRDFIEIGHSGIDLVSPHGTVVYAVGAGTIVAVEAATDGFAGSNVRLLLKGDRDTGEGWVFWYEHITLEPGLGVGSQVSSGQRIASNALTQVGISNHFELSWAFESLRFHRNQTCWVDHLAAGERSSLQTRFDELRAHPHFVGAWETVDFGERMLPFKALLDAAQHPGGARLCYPRGTDVRQPS